MNISIEGIQQVARERARTWRVSGKVREDFYRAMAKTADDGLPQMEVLERLRKNFAKTNHPMSWVIQEVLGRIRGKRGGSRAELKTVGTELAGIVPDSEALLIQAGESAGRLAEGYRNAADYIQDKRRIKAAITGAMAKPITYFSAFLGLLLFFSIRLLPAFEKARPRHQWPPDAAALGWVADNVYIIVSVLAGGLLVFIGVVAYLSVNWVGEGRDSADRRLPPFPLLAQIHASNLMSALAGFIASGIPFTEAVDRVRRSSGGYMRWQCSRLIGFMRAGKRPEEVLIMLPMIHPKYHWIIDIYGMGSDASVTYKNIAREMMDETLKQINIVFGGIISNFFLALLGGGIIWVYFSMMGIASTGQGV